MTMVIPQGHVFTYDTRSCGVRGDSVSFEGVRDLDTYRKALYVRAENRKGNEYVKMDDDFLKSWNFRGPPP